MSRSGARRRAGTRSSCAKSAMGAHAHAIARRPRDGRLAAHQLARSERDWSDWSVCSALEAPGSARADGTWESWHALSHVRAMVLGTGYRRNFEEANGGPLDGRRLRRTLLG